MGRTCGEPNEIKKNTHPKNITALFRDQDYGEQCDCGDAAVDPHGCCNCATCQLGAGKECATAGHNTTDSSTCCDASTCSTRGAHHVCRTWSALSYQPLSCISPWRR